MQTAVDGAHPPLRSMSHKASHGNAGGHAAVAVPVTFMERGRSGGRSLEARQDGTANAILTPNGGRGGMGVGAVAYSIQERAVCENPKAGPDGAGIRDDGAAYTLEARGTPQAVAAGWAVRRLMPVECERLQGFPDDYTRISWRGKPPETCPDGPRYKALGNSMSVNAMHWLGERIALVDGLDHQGQEGAT